MNLRNGLRDLLLIVAGAMLPVAVGLYFRYRKSCVQQEINRLFVPAADTDRNGTLSEAELQEVCREVYARQESRRTGQPETDLRETAKNYVFSTDLTSREILEEYLLPRGLGIHLK